MTILDGADDRRRALIAGARVYVVKPFSGQQLIGFIRRPHQLECAPRGVLN